MEIVSVEPFDRDALVSSLRRVRLSGGEPVYEHARIDLAPATDPETLTPAQRYVLKPGVAKILELREALLPLGVDVFALDGGVYVRTSDDPDETVPVIPPVVEESQEPDGRTVLMVNDGIHRVYAARSLGLPITVATVHDVPAEHPYYAYALGGGWSDVVELDDLPDGFVKKSYRRPDGYKALFRDFNAVFPGVQKERKNTNPSHLRA